MIRRQRLERRIRKKYPLFADQFIRDELAKKPDYYAGITDPDLKAARSERIESEEREIAELIAAYKDEVKNGMA